jgi:hypothetical protein
MTAWRIERISLSCPLPPAAALRHLAAGIDARHRRHLRQHLYAEVDFVILGHAEEHGIRICAARPHVTNSLRVHLHARLVPDGSGSRLEGHFGWLPSTRFIIAAQVIVPVLALCGLLGYIARSLVIGLPVQKPVEHLIGISIMLPFIAGMASLCERLARPEAVHLREWLAARLDVPAPPPAPPPPPPAGIRPPVPT